MNDTIWLAFIAVITKLKPSKVALTDPPITFIQAKRSFSWIYLMERIGFFFFFSLSGLPLLQ